MCVSAEDGVRTGEEEGKTYARVVCIYSTQMSGIRRFSFSDFPGVKNSEWKGGGLNRVGGGAAHNSLSLDAAALFCCCML